MDIYFKTRLNISALFFLKLMNVKENNEIV